LIAAEIRVADRGVFSTAVIMVAASSAATNATTAAAAALCSDDSPADADVSGNAPAGVGTGKAHAIWQRTRHTFGDYIIASIATAASAKKRLTGSLLRCSLSA
jgi:hypothetical protein